jgi:hypothetical protein
MPRQTKYFGRNPGLNLVKMIFALCVLSVLTGSIFINPQPQGLDSTADSYSHGVPMTITKAMMEEPKCLVHAPMNISAQEKRVSDPSITRLEQTTGICARLHRDWSHNPPLSKYAKQIASHQADCTKQVLFHTLDNTFGLGSHVVLWSQAMCNAMQKGYRMRSYEPDWLWLDQQHCDSNQAHRKSPLLCYFPNSEYKCGDSQEVPVGNVTDPRIVKKFCDTCQTEQLKKEWRAASTEYLFERVGTVIIQEAQRQIGLLFGAQGAPEDLITVHIRWGDKFWEMDLAKIDEYMDAIKQLLPSNTQDMANIYLATEDPKALDEFLKAKPSGWNVYYDITIKELNPFRPKKGNRASWATRNTKGRAGLVALGSLLVALEANMFVLTTKSNWSTLMNHLRTNIVDPRCGNCTEMIDLRPGAW